MDAVPNRPVNDSPNGDTSACLEERLERGEVVNFPACPFPLPGDDDLKLLMEQRLAGRHKSIAWDPQSGRISGVSRQDAPGPERLCHLLASFSQAAAEWLAAALPRYSGRFRPDRASLHPEEEATRCLRQSPRNDLLHIDAFPRRPTRRTVRPTASSGDGVTVFSPGNPSGCQAVRT